MKHQCNRLVQCPWHPRWNVTKAWDDEGHWYVWLPGSRHCAYHSEDYQDAINYAQRGARTKWWL